MPSTHWHPVADAVDKASDSSNSGPVQSDEAAAEEQKVIIVYITGYGSFRNITENPSSQITNCFLPETEVFVKLSSTSTVKIIIKPHPTALRVSYADVEKAVKEIYDDKDFDYILHLGVGLNGGYKLETIAWGDGYYGGDVDGLVPGNKKAVDENVLKKQGLLKHWGGEWVVAGTENREKGWMGTGLDVNWICKMIEKGKMRMLDTEPSGELEGKPLLVVDEDDEDANPEDLVDGNRKKKATTSKSKSKDRPESDKAQKGYIIKPSTNAGRYLCEYIFRKSLEQAISRRKDSARRPWDWRYRTGEDFGRPQPEYEAENISKRALFMHVPCVGQPYSIADGVKALEQVVVGMVLDGEGWRKKK